MHVLLVTMYYYPEPHSIPHDLAVELIKRGHTVDVITGFPNYPSGKIYDGYQMKHWQRETIESVQILRLPFYINRSKSALPRILSYLSFTISVTILGLFMVKRPDVIWTYQVGLPGVTLSTLKRSPLIHEVQDLWPEWGETGTTGMKRGLFKLLDQQERFIYRFARAVVAISDGFRRILITKKVPTEKIHIIPNWANEQNFRPVCRDPQLGGREQLDQTFNIMYVGNIGTAQGLDVVLEAASQLHDLPDLRFVIIGDGVDRERLTRIAASRSLNNVRFLGSRPQSEAANYLAWADAVLIHLKNDQMYAITIPSKTYAYLACGRPILVAANGEVADLVKELEAGVVCAPEDPLALAKAVRQLYDMPKTDREKLGTTGRAMFEARFSRQILVDQYEALFKSIM